ncbi:MAG: pilus assembly protein [Actinobacteria bacterium]|nr:pilus assembly protein [Actinomycetota bacterium]
MTPRRREMGQASIEVLSLLPVLVLLAIAAVQVAAMLAAASAAQDDARRRAVAATGRSGAMMTVTGVAPMPAMPTFGHGFDPATVRAAIRLP